MVEIIYVHGAHGGLVFTLPSTFTSFGLPGATSTSATRINNAGKTTGYYFTSDGHAHGFIAQLSGND